MAASNQIFLFTGENQFRLRQEKKTWTQEFIKKHGVENCLQLSSTDVTFSSLGDEISAAPFIAEKRLIIIDGIPKGDSEDIKQLPKMIHEHCILLFIEATPDKRLGTVKTLLTIATVKEFTHLKGSALSQWIDDYAKSIGTSIAKDARDLLLHIVGEDEDQLSTELQKLSLRANRRSITKEDVDLLVVPAGEQEVWILTSALTKGDAKFSLETVRGLITRGEDAQSLWNILLWFLRQVAATKAAALSGERSAQALAQKVGVAFPTARALLPVIDRVSLPALQHLLQESIDADIALKTGGHKATHEAPEEALALLDRLVLGLTQLFSAHPTRSV